MSLINVAIVAVDGFSPFHYSVPCILFGDSVSGEKRFNVTICAETPGFLTSKDGFALNATQDYSAIGQAQFIAQPVPKDTRDGRINGLIDYLQQHITEPHSLDSLAEVVSMSRRTLTRHFVKATGMSVADWLTAERLRRSQILLEAGNMPIESVAELVGFNSAVTWRQQFKARFGVSPAEWRKTFRVHSSL